MFQTFLDYEPLITMAMLIFIMLITLILYIKVRRWVLILVIYLMSMVIFGQSLNISLPLAPYFQIFFIMFQTILFVMTSLDASKVKEKRVDLL